MRLVPFSVPKSKILLTMGLAFLTHNWQILPQVI
jgi:hypothetical protein